MIMGRVGEDAQLERGTRKGDDRDLCAQRGGKGAQSPGWSESGEGSKAVCVMLLREAGMARNQGDSHLGVFAFFVKEGEGLNQEPGGGGAV